MKRGGFLKRNAPLRVKGHSETTDIKQEIQDTLRAIVIARDGTCILRGIRHCSDTVLQADHLITRANSATYADTRLVVCLCRSCHGGWKKWNEKQYDALVKTLISPERVALWERCGRDSWRPVRAGIYDWKLALAALKQELRQMQE